MATVYLAQHMGTGEPCAIKILPSHLAQSPQRITRFKREIALALRFDHPHIVSVFDAGCEQETPFLAMEYLPLGSLAQEMLERLSRHQVFAIEQAVEMARQVALALDYAHRHGIVHRDVTPGNILRAQPVGEGTDGDHWGRVCYKLGDFGLALEEGVTRLSLAGGIGTVDYVSPESVLPDARVDERSDIYSLGVVLYEMLAGRSLFIAEHPLAKLHKLVHEQHVPLSQLRADVSKPLNTLVERALAKHPARRFQSAKAFAQALEALQKRSTRRGDRWLRLRTQLAKLMPFKWRQLAPRFRLSKRFGEYGWRFGQRLRWMVGLILLITVVSIVVTQQPVMAALWPGLQSWMTSAQVAFDRQLPSLRATLTEVQKTHSSLVRAMPTATVIAHPVVANSLSNTNPDTLTVTNISSDTLLVRQHPAMSGTIISRLQPKQSVTVMGRSSDGRWWLIALEGDATGWVFKATVRTTGNESAVPIVVVANGS
jgi:serine/threonine-protein kinase